MQLRLYVYSRTGKDGTGRTGIRLTVLFWLFFVCNLEKEITFQLHCEESLRC